MQLLDLRSQTSPSLQHKVLRSDSFAVNNWPSKVIWNSDLLRTSIDICSPSFHTSTSLRMLAAAHSPIKSSVVLLAYMSGFICVGLASSCCRVGQSVERAVPVSAVFAFDVFFVASVDDDTADIFPERLRSHGGRLRVCLRA